jgi:hypothetical protein
MIPIHQTRTQEEFANCLQACVASYFEFPLENVPNFMLFKDNWWDALHWYFFSLGYDIGHINKLPPEDGKYYIVSEEFGDNYNYSHAVIWKDGKIVHDPLNYKSGKRGTIVGYYWISKR